MKPTDSDSYAALIAIDWAAAKHDVCLRAGAEGPLERTQIEHTPEALTQWIASLRERFGGQPVAVGLEQSRGALIHALMGHEFLVLYPINPAALAKFRRAFAISGAKDDPTDAELLLEMLAKHRDRLRAWKPQDAPTRALTLLVEDRRRAVNERTRICEQIHATLKGYFPQAFVLCGENLASLMACDFLLKWPTLAAAQAARPDTLRRFYHAHQCRSTERIEQRLKLLASAQPLTTDPAIVQAGVLRMQTLVRQLRALLPQIATYDREIESLFAAHPDAPIFEALPGAGAVLAPRLLTAFGPDRARWQHAGEIQAYSGIAPVVERSGKQCWTHVRYACPRFLRQTFHEFAASSRFYCDWAKTFYHAKIAEGKGHHAAVRALAYKWIRILFHCWKRRESYDPARVILAIAQRPQTA